MAINARLKAELTVAVPIVPGKSAGAKLVQEYLNLNNLRIGIDGDWGPATTKALQAIIPGAIAVDQAALTQLAQPLIRMLIPQGAGTLRDGVQATALRHLRAHPIEIGGPNAGPYVREYMDGHEGAAWPWCAGFVTRVIAQAAEGVDGSVPAHLRRTYSCDILGAAAKKASKLVSGGSLAARPGDVFLVRGKHPNDWIHTGLIVEVDAQTFTTIEGNTNDQGSRDGFEVCRRFRRRNVLDVVLL